MIPPIPVETKIVKCLVTRKRKADVKPGWCKWARKEWDARHAGETYYGHGNENIRIATASHVMIRCPSNPLVWSLGVAMIVLKAVNRSTQWVLTTKYCEIAQLQPELFLCASCWDNSRCPFRQTSQCASCDVQYKSAKNDVEQRTRFTKQFKTGLSNDEGFRVT